MQINENILQRMKMTMVLRSGLPPSDQL